MPRAEPQVDDIPAIVALSHQEEEKKCDGPMMVEQPRRQESTSIDGKLQEKLPSLNEPPARMMVNASPSYRSEMQIYHMDEESKQ